jgi:TldD protein
LNGYLRDLDLNRILKDASRRGASYADVRYQSTELEIITVENKNLESYSSRKLSGVGIRTMVKGAFGFAATSDLSESGLQKVLEASIKAGKAVGTEKKLFSKTAVNKANVKLPMKEDFDNISPEDKVSVTLDANRAAWISPEVKNVSTRLGMVKDFRAFMSSEGTRTEVENSICGLMNVSVAKVNGVMEWVPHSESRCAGYEYVQSMDWNAFASSISKLAVEAAGSKTPPSGPRTVVLDNRVVGLLLHEAFGHASEGDLVFTAESVLNNRLGTKLASQHVTIIDEGTKEGGYYYPYDDEGTKKEKTTIVEKGTLKRYIHDRKSAAYFNAESTGNGRAQDFECMPIVRQTNYYMEPRDHKFEELIEDVDNGIYLRGRGGTGGQVEVGMGTFTFSIGPSKIIRKGELAETVRGVVISGLILETLNTIEAVGNDLKLYTGVFGGCGKNDQSVYVGFGGPHIRVGKMTVGGR